MFEVYFARLDFNLFQVGIAVVQGHHIAAVLLFIRDIQDVGDTQNNPNSHKNCSKGDDNFPDKFRL